ncbi:asparagine synthase (glutamine-hydrolyzing) [Brevundimonas diminuta]|uniref:asparagine synthase (glutamine-hydrolyzing) n=1 Tax=Brevundimonas diminuta TaxID=293 RepID=UPI0030FB4A11
MCGIVGYIASSDMVGQSALVDMATAISHRGRDGSGVWRDTKSGVGLAHRRLAILDLSEAGHQPMTSANGKLILVYNGEIYNHRTIRSDLEASGWSEGWSGYSDTETLLAALQVWGVAQTLPRLNGMFAFALWDRDRRVLTLARDRLGEKPLFYGTAGKDFVFGSELKAVVRYPTWRGEIDRDVLSLYLRHGYVPAPYCIYRGMAKLSPGHWVEATETGVGEPICYWDLKHFTSMPRRQSPPQMLVDELEERLKRAVALRMEADVPLGAFLSGGIDSSSIVALMQSQASRPVKTFTIGFDVPGYNEAENAKAVARHLGTDHTELYLAPEDVLSVVPDLPSIWDEPFADSSQIPTLLLSRMTKQHVSVALSGDAGDELFCGYNRYGQGYALHQHLRRLPAPLRLGLASVLKGLPAHAIDRAVRHLPQPLRYPALGDRLNKLGGVLSKAEGADFYRTLVSQFHDPTSLALDSREPTTLLAQPQSWPPLNDFREIMMYLDTLTYLPGDILTKVDRATMAVGLEARAPFLDHELVEFAWSLPLSVKLNGGQTKWALRQVLRRHVPDALIDRPKMGFGIPIEHWLSGPLRDWAESLLSEEKLVRDGYLDAVAVRQLWHEQLTGKRRWHHQLWTILMFNAWLENNAQRSIL